MWTIDRFFCLAFFVILSILDIRRHALPDRLLVLGTAGAVVRWLILRDIDGWLFLSGGLFGALFFLVSKGTREQFGYGDSFGILILGLMTGFWQALWALAAAFFLLLLAVIPLLVVKKMSRKASLPFFPFLTGGYLILLVSEGGAV